MIRAFTLVELLVVVAIVGILAALLMPGLARARALAQGTACSSNLRQVGIALRMYVDDNANRMPMMRDRWVGDETDRTDRTRTNNLPSPDAVLAPHLGSGRVWRCAADRAGLFERTGSSYAWNSLLNGQDADRLRVFAIEFKAQQVPVFYDKEGFHEARGPRKAVNYLYADGHLRNLLVLEGTR